MVEENIIQEFRLKNIGETKNYFIKKISQNELMSKKHTLSILIFATRHVKLITRLVLLNLYFINQVQ